MSKEQQNDILDVSEEEGLDLSGEREIIFSKDDMAVQALMSRHEKGRLITDSEFQRRFLWNTTKSSLLIESAVLDIPLPTIYLSEDPDGKLIVIDGQQRLTSFFDFMKNKFRLTGLVERSKLNGKRYSDLHDQPQVQERISECSLRVITFKKDSDSELKFKIFQRLNSGAVALNAQEMRNCIYHGRYNVLLLKLSKNPTFRKITGFADDKRMKDVEFVLRFAAFSFQSYRDYSSPMKKFLNSEMHKRQNISISEEQKLEEKFKTAVASILSVFGDKPFRRWMIDEKSNDIRQESKQLNASIYDILMYSFAQADRNSVMRHSDAIKKRFIHLMTSDNDFIKSITAGTSGKSAIRKRFRIWETALDEILDDDDEPRCFPHALKKELFDKNPTCALCQNQINHIDDAAVDHIEQYWLGGKTIPENARLTHKYCNNTRARKE